MWLDLVGESSAPRPSRLQICAAASTPACGEQALVPQSRKLWNLPKNCSLSSISQTSRRNRSIGKCGAARNAAGLHDASGSHSRSSIQQCTRRRTLRGLPEDLTYRGGKLYNTRPAKAPKVSSSKVSRSESRICRVCLASAWKITSPQGCSGLDQEVLWLKHALRRYSSLGHF